MNVRTLTLAIALGGLAALPGLSETASHYVQEGLLACWDGVENAGADPHDAEATVWRDLVAERAFDLTGVTVGANGMEFAGTANSYGILSAADTAATFERATNGTLEVVYSSRDTSGHHALLQSSKTANSAMGFWNTREFIANNNTDNKQSPEYVCPISTATNTMTVRYAQAKPTAALANGEALATGNNDGWGAANDKTTIGTRSSFGNSHFKGTIFSIRVYDRPLTDAEIAANRALDVRRFIDGITYDGGQLVISGSRGDAGSATPAYGSYPGIADGDERPVAATPAVTNAAGDVAHICTGWKLYGEDGVLIDDGTETAFTYVHAGGATTRTLEWQWKAEYKVAATADAGGSAAVAAPWVAEGAEAVFTATPDAGMAFRYWVDEGDVILTRENPLAIAVNEPRTLRAVFGDASVSGWTYDAAARTLTQNVAEDETPWVLTATLSGGTNLAVTAVKTVGSPAVLDFSGPLTDGGDTRYRIQSMTGFASQTTIEYVVLPTGLETLGRDAFLQCTGLTTVEPLLPDTLTELGQRAFAGCTSLRGDPVFPANTITSPYKWSTGTWGWFNGSQITSCDMSAATMTEIVYGSFSNCPQLKWVRLPQGVTTYGNSCFYNCPELESITPFLPAGVTSIGSAAFRLCPKLRGDLVIAGLEPLTFVYVYNAGGSFEGTAISSATITAPAKDTNGYLFRNCKQLEWVVLPDTLESLLGSDFYGCTSLTNVTPFLPSSLTSIGRESFRGCTSLAIPLTLSGANDIAIAENYQGNMSFFNAAITSARITAPMTDIGGTYNNGKNAGGGAFRYSQTARRSIPPADRPVRPRQFLRQLHGADERGFRRGRPRH